MDSDRAERLYNKALGMVLWGEKKDDVFRTLEVNGITGREAEAV